MSHEDWAADWPFLSRIARDEGRGSRAAAGATRGIDDLERLAALRHMRGGPRSADRGGRRRAVRRRPRPPAPRRRPDGGADPARRGAAQRLPADADDRGAQRRPLAPEPGLGLPDARPARGRGPDPRDRARRAPSCSSSPTRAGSRLAAVRRPDRAPWEDEDDPDGRSIPEIASLIIQIGKAAWQVAQEGDERQVREGVRDARRDPPGAVRDPRRGHRRRAEDDGRDRVTCMSEMTGGNGARDIADRRRDRGPRPRQELRRGRGGQGRRVRGRHRRGVRVPRTQRRRQDDHDQHAVHAGHADGGLGERRRSRRRARARRRPPQHRPGVPGPDARRLPDRRAEPAPARRALRRRSRTWSRRGCSR